VESRDKDMPIKKEQKPHKPAAIMRITELRKLERESI